MNNTKCTVFCMSAFCAISRSHYQRPAIQFHFTFIDALYYITLVKTRNM